MDKAIREQLYDPKGRKMSVKSQMAFIKKRLKQKGIEPDIVDVEALIDPTLSYRENYENIVHELTSKGKINPELEGIIKNPACSKAKDIKAAIRKHQKKDPKLAGLKADYNDAKTQCDCSSCAQMGLYDPSPRKRKLRGQHTLTTRTRQKTLPLSRPPKNWFYAMVEGIKKSSDVRNPASIAASIWRRLSPRKKAEIKLRERKGEQFTYDLPLPEDHATKGTGTVRIVNPFKLAEVQVNVPRAAYDRIRKSGLFQKMKRDDGSFALVKRCKSSSGNCNIFVDRM